MKKIISFFAACLVALSALFLIVTVLQQSSNNKGICAIAGEVTQNMNKAQAATVDAKLALGTKIAAGVFVVFSLLLWMFG